MAKYLWYKFYSSAGHEIMAGYHTMSKQIYIKWGLNVRANPKQIIRKSCAYAAYIEEKLGKFYSRDFYVMVYVVVF